MQEYQSTSQDLLEGISDDLLCSLAALYEAPEDVVDLALSILPRKERQFVLQKGFASADKRGRLRANERGRLAISLSAERCPEPYADISLDELSEATEAAIAVLVEQSGIRLREPKSRVPPLAKRSRSA